MRSFSLVVVAALVGAATTSVARTGWADDAACIAASENEVALRKEQHLKEALKQLVACGDPSCPAVIRAECNRRTIAINAAIPTIVLAATDPAGGDLAAVTVTVDGAPFASSLDGRSLAIDPGSHTVRFESPGREPVEKTLIVREGEKERHLNVVLTPAAAAAGSSTWSTSKTLALVSGGVGLIGIGVGAAFGAMASSEWSTQQKDCGSSAACPNHPGAVSAHDSTETDGAVSTAMFVVGAAGVAGALILWFTAPKAEKRPAAPLALHFLPSVGPGGAGMTLGGTFE
jgi:hypothetical protein